jgi:hypothetical protein
MDEAFVGVALLPHLGVHDTQDIVAGGERTDLVYQRGFSFAARELGG